MITGAASKGRTIAVYQRPCSAMMSRGFLAGLDLGLDLFHREIGDDPARFAMWRHSATLAWHSSNTDV
jgi:hypothetical protein